MYLWLSFSMFILGGAFAMIIRAELYQPGMQLIEPEFFNQMTTMHGLVMVFGAIMPAFVGLANWMIPLMIGAPNVALPRMNNLSFWILPPTFLLLMSTLLMPGGAPSADWSLVAPSSAGNAVTSLTYFVLSVHLLGLSSIMGSINIIATVIKLRAPGMTFMKMPLFVWTWFITAFLLIVVMPVLAGAVTMVLMDVRFGTSFFPAAGGSDPLLFQHVFWFFGHPEVYIVILPAFGVISQIIPTFSRKPLFGYDSMVYATAAIAFLSFIVWVHHVYTVGGTVAQDLFFMYATLLIAIPAGVQVFNWVATMWRGALTFETPMMFALGFMVLFTIGGFSGLMLSSAPVNFQYHDSYFVVAHFHYVMVAGAIFSLTAAVYYWLPKWCGRMYNEKLGQLHFWVAFIGFNMTFLPQHFVGLAGMPRRIPDYALQFTDFNMLSSVGSFIYAASQVLFLYNVVATIVAGKPTTEEKVWEGAQGLEWTLPTPSPHDTFETPPLMK
ncbi:MAG: cytochrome c oxidase subunit 1 [Halieaceae bacterium]|jgi:cytochrome c oxidase subunit I|nr:cytochrome c oxidase subunit 1 [Halieaceae bacterium]